MEGKSTGIIDKAIKYLSYVTCWESYVDDFMHTGRCDCNRWFTSFIVYIAILMGMLRAVIIEGASDLTLDDVYALMSPQCMGVGLIAQIYMVVESFALCWAIEDKFMRVICISVFMNLGYIFGIYEHFFAHILLFVVMVCYVLHIGLLIVRGLTSRGLRNS